MRSRAKGGGAVSFNMTPMIDIVFNLIIFFMLVSQFYQLKVERVKLPPAAKADPKKDLLPKFTQVVINVMAPDTEKDPNDRTTRIKVGGKTIVTSVMFGEVPEWQPLIDLLRERREAAENNKLKPVNVILRADERVQYETIGSIMLCASHAGIRYWWVQAYRPSSSPNKDQAIKEYLGVPLDLR